MLTRRQFAQLAASMGATLVAGCSDSDPFHRNRRWTERRELFPQGVASGDPQPDSVILWTRRAPITGDRGRKFKLGVEVATDPTFKKIHSQWYAEVSAATDYTVRFLVIGLQPATEYWYRF